MAARHSRILNELADMELSLARDLNRRAATARSPEDLAALGLAFEWISRSARQTIALKAKLERGRAVREDRVETDGPAEVGGGAAPRRSVHRQNAD